MADHSNSLTLDEERRDAEILARHLHPQFTGSLEPEAAAAEEESAASSGQSPELQSSLKLQAGDIHRDLYRIEARSKQARLDKRAASFSFPPRQYEDENGEVVSAQEPGSFRRHFLRHHHRHRSSTLVLTTRNFVEFLDLYGSFAGEDLAETEDESSVGPDHEGEGEEQEEPGERRPLLGRRRRVSRMGRPGDASNMKSFFTLLKAFIGTGIMFLPKAFRNGGILFSSITLVSVAAITALCFHLLLQCRKHYGGGYGEIGERIAGPRLRALILGSITLSQLSFVCAGIIFTAENMHTFLRAVASTTDAHHHIWSTNQLIFLQLLILIPLAFIRNISKLGPAALLADVFILIGLTYIYYYDIATIASRHGLAPSVVLFNPSSFTLTIGSSIFTFEGIGLILPIQSSMRKPEQFGPLLYTVMAIITVLFTAVGALSYGTFGEATKTEIITNFPQGDRFVNAVQFLYSLAVLVGTPVQLFPAVRIMEGRLFGRLSGKRDPSIKWKKNVFRTAIVLLCTLISVLGAGDLDKFVALIGSFACIPLVYIYPAYLHWRGVASSPYVKCRDLLIAVLGFALMVYSTATTVSVWVHSGGTRD
ncbi:hypothetical protein ASPZODRAFT_17234 [Penicilliopsis zonata CBS 506.65]|uniref:Amino acid transporter transmembrane domain-containing protein n=1 Tax=Penicilliopsis zonata CBS 506.65 TaxID=1073090 RepID=A0A1L9SF68_9EURO|nr:hypothetical protein ASPZODRAFT_17234 [Penicilliopsis zonata CBS 506.65]OJJ45792.1 hypothetical protein ASPZODRAFT_17234 [Penicilliopsis zonata CBS 506.65]